MMGAQTVTTTPIVTLAQLVTTLKSPMLLTSSVKLVPITVQIAHRVAQVALFATAVHQALSGH